MTKKSALIIGCTGLVGSKLLAELSTLYDKVYAVSRKPVETNETVEWLSFDQANNLEVTDFFNCLGTTIKKVGSKEKFRAVDVEIPLKVLAQNKFRRCFNISSTSASLNSPFFYLKCKGELENEINAKNLELSIHYRPSTLEGDRNEKRIGESIGLKLTKVFRFIPFLDRFAPTPVENIIHLIKQDLNSELKGIYYREASTLNQSNSF